MASRNSGKAADRSSAWSEWAWDDSGYWIASRYNVEGKVEYDYRYPEATQTPQAVPRSPGPNVLTTSVQYSPAIPSPSFIHHADTNNAYTADSINQPEYAGNSISKSSTTPEYNDYHQGHSSSSEQTRGLISLSSEATYNVDDATRSFGNFSLESTSASGYDAPSQGSEMTALNYATTASLSPRYKVIDAREQKKFWKVGRVFLALWTEPARHSAPQGVRPKPGAHSTASEQFCDTYLGAKAFTEIRRYVIVQEGYGNSLCCPIHTYGGQATLKHNLPEAQQHAIIYTSDKPPDEYYYVANNGTTVFEALSRDPIKVRREQKSPEGDLGTGSRINYSKIYTIENYVKVLNIGMVEPGWIETLRANSFVRRDGPVEKPRDRPPRTSKRDERRDDDKDKSKSSGKAHERRHKHERH